MTRNHVLLFEIPKPPVRPLDRFNVHCPRDGCTHLVSATTEGKALQALASHYKYAHLQTTPTEAA